MGDKASEAGNDLERLKKRFEKDAERAAKHSWTPTVAVVSPFEFNQFNVKELKSSLKYIHTYILTYLLTYHSSGLLSMARSS